MIGQHDGQDKEEEKKHDEVKENEAQAVVAQESDRQQPHVQCQNTDSGQISAWQFYKGTQRLSRTVRKQLEKQDHFSGR